MFDFLQLGIANYNKKLQIGLLNLHDENPIQFGILNVAANNHRKTTIQIGLLNYNRNAFLPWMPFIHCSSGTTQE